MNKACIYVIYDNHKKPLIASIYNCDNGKQNTIPLYISGSNKSIYDIEASINIINKVVLHVLNNSGTLIIPNFKEFIKAFNIPLIKESVDVYSRVLEQPKISNINVLAEYLNKATKLIANQKCESWQKLIASAAFVYQSMENNGIQVGYIDEFPIWSQDTFTGRSKCTGFNIQGATDELIISNRIESNNVFMHFDWCGADIRIASLLSNDNDLQRNSCSEDIYQATADIINNDSDCDDKLSRSECKLALLSAINSLSCHDVILSIYPVLNKWISKCSNALNRRESLYTILGRKFSISDDRGVLSVFNATMQGSIVHAMHSSLKRIWNIHADRVIADLHDGIVCTCTDNKADMLNMINTVVDIMNHPFDGILESNPFFSVKVSIGKRWKRWKPYKIFHQ